MTCDWNGRKRGFLLWMCLSGCVHNLRVDTASYALIRIVSAVENLITMSLGDCCGLLRWSPVGRWHLAACSQKVGQVGVLIQASRERCNTLKRQFSWKQVPWSTQKISSNIKPKTFSLVLGSRKHSRYCEWSCFIHTALWQSQACPLLLALVRYTDDAFF